MPRAPRRTRKEVITAQIADLDEKIDVYQSKIDDCKAAQAELQKELDAIAMAEDKAAQEAAIKDVMAIMKEKGLTAEELKEMLNEHSKEEE